MDRPLEAYVAPGARLVGDVRLGRDAGVFNGTVINAEAASVTVEAEANVQDNCVVEAVPGRPVIIGSRTSLGHNARVYGATIGPAALIAIGATVLAGARVGEHAIVAANAVVPEGMEVPPGKLVIGQGRILRDVTQAEIDRIESGATEYARLSREYRYAKPDLPPAVRERAQAVLRRAAKRVLSERMREELGRDDG